MEIKIIDCNKNVEIPQIIHNDKVYLISMHEQEFKIKVKNNYKIPNGYIGKVNLFINNKSVYCWYLFDNCEFTFEGWPLSNKLDEFRKFKFSNIQYSDDDSSSTQSKTTNIIPSIKLEFTCGKKINKNPESNIYYSNDQEEVFTKKDTKFFNNPSINTVRGDYKKIKTNISKWQMVEDKRFKKVEKIIYYDDLEYLKLRGIKIDNTIITNYYKKLLPIKSNTVGTKRKRDSSQDSIGSSASSRKKQNIKKEKSIIDLT